MPSGTRTLDQDALWRLAEYLDLPAILDAAAREAANSAQPACPALTSGPAGTAGAAEFVVHRSPVTGEFIELPAAALSVLRAAGCAAAAARRLLAPGVLTVGVVGPVPEVWWHIAVLCRSLAAVTHVAVAADVSTVPVRLTDQLDLAGVGLSGAASAQAAAFGASLVVAAGPAAITAEHLIGGALLVEAAPDAFPAPLYSYAEAVLPAGAEGNCVRGGFTVVLPPANTAVLDAALAAELAAELVTADTRSGLTRRD